MSITREQVADLQPGDRVRISGWYDLTVEGDLSGAPSRPLTLWLGQYTLIRDDRGDPGHWARTPEATLTVVSRAPRPLYVNHPRTEPVHGDVVRDADGDDTCTWVYGPVDIGGGRLSNPWTSHSDSSGLHVLRNRLPERLRLLVDGETGRVVP